MKELTNDEVKVLIQGLLVQAQSRFAMHMSGAHDCWNHPAAIAKELDRVAQLMRAVAG